MSYLRNYIELMEKFLNGEISPQQFERRYLDTHSKDTNFYGDPIGCVLMELFSDIDTYCSDPKLRKGLKIENSSQEVYDEKDLFEAVKKAYKGLSKLEPALVTPGFKVKKNPWKRYGAMNAVHAAFLKAKADKILAVGRLFNYKGNQNWALTKSEALDALEGLLKAGIPVLGGGVYETIEGAIEPNYDYDAWYTEFLPNETKKDFLIRSVSKAKNYIENYKAAEPGKIFFALVPADM